MISKEVRTRAITSFNVTVMFHFKSLTLQLFLKRVLYGMGWDGMGKHMPKSKIWNKYLFSFDGTPDKIFIISDTPSLLLLLRQDCSAGFHHIGDS